MADDKKPAPPRAFGGGDLYKLQQACEKLQQTQMGALMEPFTAEELLHLFVPKDYRSALKLVYKLENRVHATGNIYIDLTALMAPNERHELFPDDQFARSILTKAVMRLYFQRDHMMDGFVTPSPVFGSKQEPVRTLKGSPGAELTYMFRERAMQLLWCWGEWMFVKWTLDKLQNSVRTPQQVRYVWPCIQTLARVAELNMDLTMPSVRAGLNATPDPKCAPYLRATNDVVANSVLLGVKSEYQLRYQRHEMMMVDTAFTYGDAGERITLDIQGY